MGEAETALAMVKAQRSYERAKAAFEVARREMDGALAALNLAREARARWDERSLAEAWQRLEAEERA